MSYSFSQLYNALLGQGIPSGDAQTLAGVGIAESSGNPSAINFNTNGSTDYGLWQVNSAAWPQLNPSSLQGADINTQAAAAAQVYQQRGLGAWATYNSGAYQKYVQPVTNDPLGYSVTQATQPGTEDAPSASQWNDIPDDTFDSSAATTALGNDQGTPNLGGGITSSALPSGTTGTPLPGQQNTGEASIAGQSVQKGLGTAGTDVENAAGGIAGTIASTINSIEQYTTSAFVIAALVVLGVIFVAYGLGLFGKRTLAEAGI